MKRLLVNNKYNWDDVLAFMVLALGIDFRNSERLKKAIAGFYARHR